MSQSSPISRSALTGSTNSSRSGALSGTTTLRRPQVQAVTGSAVVLKLTKHGDQIEELQTEIADLKDYVAGLEQAITALEEREAIRSTSYEYAMTAIKNLEREYDGVFERFEAMDNREESEPDSSDSDSLTQHEKDRIEASLAAYSDPSFKVSCIDKISSCRAYKLIVTYTYCVPAQAQYFEIDTGQTAVVPRKP